MKKLTLHLKKGLIGIFGVMLLGFSSVSSAWVQEYPYNIYYPTGRACCSVNTVYDYPYYSRTYEPVRYYYPTRYSYPRHCVNQCDGRG